VGDLCFGGRRLGFVVYRLVVYRLVVYRLVVWVCSVQTWVCEETTLGS